MGFSTTQSQRACSTMLLCHPRSPKVSTSLKKLIALTKICDQINSGIDVGQYLFISSNTLVNILV